MCIRINMAKTQTTIIHYPRLDTIIMVEETIRKAKDYPNKMQLWKALPKQVMYQTFNTIINYLENSGKIYITKDGKVMWTWNPKLMRTTVPA